MAAMVAAAAITTAGSLYAQNKASKDAKKAASQAGAAAGAADPYAAYRGDAAKKLDALSKNPDSIVDSAVWKARQQAAARAIASQGYTGSGNALVAAADAGASAYQQEFDNLSRLAGADVGLQSAAGVASTGLQTSSQARSDNLSAIGGVVNNIGNLATTVAGAFNKPTGGVSTSMPTGASGGVALGPNSY